MKNKVRVLALMVLVCALRTFGADGVPAAKPEEIKFRQLAKTVMGERPPPRYPDDLRKLEGKRVRLTGYIVPYDDPEKLQKLMLIEAPGGCFYCNPPDANGVVLVRRDAKDPKLSDPSAAIVVEGTLRLWRADLKEGDEARHFAFTLDDAHARPAAK